MAAGPLLGLLLSLVALGLTRATPPLHARPFLLPFAALTVAAWFAGARAAAVATIVSVLGVAGGVAVPGTTLASPGSLVPYLLFCGLGAMVASFAHRRDRAMSENTVRRAELEAMFRQAAVGIVHVDRGGHILRANARMGEIVGRAPDALVGQTFEAITHPDDWRANRKALADLATGMRLEALIEKRLLRPDGTHVWVEVSLAILPGPGGRQDGLIAIVHDVTERRAAEDALRLAARRKDEFLALLSHELRNPLAPMRTAVHLLTTTTPSPDAQARLHAMLDRQVQQLTRLVDDLLDVSRVLRGRIALQRERVDIGVLLQHAIETARPLLDAEAQHLDVAVPDQPLYVEGDAARLAQVFGNLLNNASRYSPRGARVVLAARAEGEEVVIHVSDSGIGIAPEHLPHVFELFVQADPSLARTTGGLGIGLTLVESLVALHGGRVTAHSDGVGRGSTFEVRLPAAPAGVLPEVAAALPASAVPARGVKVLIVDDNVDAADSLALLLTSAGHATRVLHDGRGVLDVAREWHPDVVLLDIGLPGLDGYAVAVQLAGADLVPAPVLIAVTGYGQATDRARAGAAGFAHHLVKPVDAVALLRLIAGIGPGAAAAR